MDQVTRKDQSKRIVPMASEQIETKMTQNRIHIIHKFADTIFMRKFTNTFQIRNPMQTCVATTCEHIVIHPFPKLKLKVLSKSVKSHQLDFVNNTQSQVVNRQYA